MAPGPPNFFNFPIPREASSGSDLIQGGDMREKPSFMETLLRRRVFRLEVGHAEHHRSQGCQECRKLQNELRDYQQAHDDILAKAAKSR